MWICLAFLSTSSFFKPYPCLEASPDAVLAKRVDFRVVFLPRLPLFSPSRAAPPPPFLTRPLHFLRVIASYQNLPVFLLSFANSSCSLIPLNSSLWFWCVSSNSLACSFFNSTNSSSSFSCHGYSTKIWKQRAEEPMRKFVRENVFVIIIPDVYRDRFRAYWRRTDPRVVQDAGLEPCRQMCSCSLKE